MTKNRRSQLLFFMLIQKSIKIRSKFILDDHTLADKSSIIHVSFVLFEHTAGKSEKSGERNKIAVTVGWINQNGDIFTAMFVASLQVLVMSSVQLALVAIPWLPGPPQHPMATVSLDTSGRIC